MQPYRQNKSFSAPTFGSAIESRAFASGEYRFGFNGMEKDSENNSGAYDFGARIYDSRLGRWLSVDAKTNLQPYVSPYKALANCPIGFKDPDGNYEWEIIKIINEKTGKEVILKVIKSDKIMTDGNVHSKTDISGSSTLGENYYYDYASTITTRLLKSDGTIEETTESDVILYENDIQDKDAIFFKSAKENETKKDWGTLFDGGERKQYQKGGFHLTSNAHVAGASETKYYSKSEAKTLNLDDLMPMLKLSKVGQLQNIFDRAQRIDATVDKIGQLIDTIKEAKKNGTPNGTTYCIGCDGNFENDSTGKMTTKEEKDVKKLATDTADSH
jgi:RHS repeat-associated protein